VPKRQELPLDLVNAALDPLHVIWVTLRSREGLRFSNKVALVVILKKLLRPSRRSEDHVIDGVHAGGARLTETPIVLAV